MTKIRLIVHRFFLLTLLGLCALGCSQGAEEAPEGNSEFQAALKKAQELNQQESYVLAELSARTAVGLKPEDKDASMALFNALSHQSTANLQDEAEEVAKKIESAFSPDSSEGKAVKEFLEGREAERELASLSKAVDSRSPDALERLEEIPEELRKEKYWHLAFKIHRNGKDHKATLNAARTWLSYKPTGLDASEAEKLLEEDKLGLYDSPETAFQSLQKLPVDQWDPYLSQRTSAKRAWLAEILKHGQVTRIEKQKSGLKVVLQLTNSHTKKSFPGSVLLGYSQDGSKQLLDFDRTSLSGAMKVFQKPGITIRSDFLGMNGAFEVRKGYQSKVLQPLNQALGKGKLKRIDMRLSKEARKVSGESSINLGTAVLYDQGEISVRIMEFNDTPGMAMAFDVDILSPSYRFENGLGVGSKVSDFDGHYMGEEVLPFKANRALIGKVNPPIAPDGWVRDFGVFGLANKRKNQGLILFTDRDGTVLGIRIPIGSAAVEPKVI